MTLGPNPSTAPAPSRHNASFPPSNQAPMANARAAVEPESKSLFDESPEDGDAVKENEFKEGGYGWFVSSRYTHNIFIPFLLLMFIVCRVVVFGVWLVNMHTWGLISVGLSPCASHHK